jgi:hypothetical protein
MPGLDPGIHPPSKESCEEDGSPWRDNFGFHLNGGAPNTSASKAA